MQKAMRLDLKSKYKVYERKRVHKKFI